MRALVLLLIFSLSALGLSALGQQAEESIEGSGEGEAIEGAGADADDAAAASPPPAPVEVRNPDDSFLPTDQLRYDQEVDYPTDI